MRRRRGGDDRLLAWKDGRRWRPLAGGDVNDYLDELFEGDFTAKDFRTWHATVLAALALADTEEPGALDGLAQAGGRGQRWPRWRRTSATPRRVAKSSYIDPRVIDLYESGTVVAMPQRAFRSPARRQEAAEKAVLELLS